MVKRGEIEAQTQARVEEDLVAALAKASGVKEELERTSQLLVDGALERCRAFCVISCSGW